MSTCRSITLVTALAAAGCVAPPGDGDERSDVNTSAAIAPGATSQALTLRTAVGGQYVTAEQGGGGAVNANRPTAQGWETFTLYDLNGGTLQSGDLVAIGTQTGHFLCAENGGGGEVNATRTDPQGWETFRVVKLGGTGTAVNNGDQIALQTQVSGLYVSALGGGGAGVVADRATASGWEAFVVGGSGSPPPPPPPTGATEYAPYFYTWGWGSSTYAFSSLAQMKAMGGPAAVTIAFVLANNGCNTTNEIRNNMADVRAYRAAGGHVKASFGGASGTYLENACGSASALAAAITRFVDDTGITDLDFDLEHGGQSSNPAINQMRGQALKLVQDTRNIKVAFTLPVAPNGLLQESINIVRAALDAGVRVAFVNGMTMDYGNGTDLGTTPIRSIDAMANQVRGLIPSLSLEQAYRMVGATAMIGKNDDEEWFTIDNANTFINHARTMRLGLVSFWAIQRDRVCTTSNELDRCSRLNSFTFQYNNIFAGVNNR